MEILLQEGMFLMQLAYYERLAIPRRRDLCLIKKCYLRLFVYGSEGLSPIQRGLINSALCLE